MWKGLVREDDAALEIPLQWKRPRKIFVNSMSDLFHEGVSDSFIQQVWSVMRATPHHHYQILTKRPKRMADVVRRQICDVLPNVWLGTSIENVEAVSRCDALRVVPAVIRFISFEPLIGPVGRVDLSGNSLGNCGRRERPFGKANQGSLDRRNLRPVRHAGSGVLF